MVSEFNQLTLHTFAIEIQLPIDFLKTQKVKENNKGIVFSYCEHDGQERKPRVKIGNSDKDIVWDVENKDPYTIPYGLQNKKLAEEKGVLHLVQNEVETLTLLFHDIPALGLVDEKAIHELRRHDLSRIKTIYVYEQQNSETSSLTNSIIDHLRYLRYQGQVFTVQLNNHSINNLHKSCKLHDLDFKAELQKILDTVISDFTLPNNQLSKEQLEEEHPKLQKFLNALENVHKKGTGSYTAVCPGCQHNSLYITTTDENRILPFCYSHQCEGACDSLPKGWSVRDLQLESTKHNSSYKPKTPKEPLPPRILKEVNWNGVEKEPLTDQDYANLANSCISRELADKAGIFRVSDDSSRLMFSIKPGQKGNFAGIIFPYIIDGQCVSYRLRLDCPDSERQPDGTTKDQNKYRSAPGSSNYPYFPPIYTQEQLKNHDLPIFIVEGEKKSLSLASWLNEQAFPSVVAGLAGCWNFKTKIEKQLNPNGSTKDVKGLLRDFVTMGLENRKIVIITDTNYGTNDSVKSAINKLKSTLKTHNANVALVEIPSPLADEGINGVDDLLYQKRSDYLMSLIKIAQSQIEKDVNQTGQGDGKERVKRPKGSIIAGLLKEHYKARLAYDATIKQFRVWDNQKWIMIDTPLVRTEVQKLVNDYYENIFSYFEGFEDRDISSVMSLLQTALTVPKWKQNRNLLPLQNGVLDLKTLKLSQHKAENFNTWVLPYAYDPNAQGELITTWLLQLAQGDIHILKLIQGFIRAVLLGRADLQIYLELIGFGGTGKGTLSRVITALIGIENTVIMDLKSLETNRFATAKLVDKRFCLINEVGSYIKDLSVFKSLTGGDRLPAERKNQPAFDFQPDCLVMISANTELKTGESTSAIARRRRHIKLDKVIADSQRRNLIEGTATGFEGEFVPHLPGLLNWILKMTDEEMVNALRNNPEKSPLYQQMKIENLLNTHPIALWFDEKVTIDPNAKAKVGEGEESIDSTLYANYKAFALATSSGISKMKTFSNSLLDLCVAQLGLKVERKRITSGVHFFGIRLRTINDPAFSLSSLDDENNNKSGDDNDDPNTPNDKPPHNNGNSSSSNTYNSYYNTENTSSDSDYSNYEGSMKDFSDYEGSMKDTMKDLLFENEGFMENEGFFHITANTNNKKETNNPTSPNKKEREGTAENGIKNELHIEVIEKSAKILHKPVNPSYATINPSYNPSYTLHTPFINEGFMKDFDNLHKSLGIWINRESKKSPVGKKVDASVLAEAQKLHQNYLHKKSHARDEQFLPAFEKIQIELEEFCKQHIAPAKERL